jgi:hypothetical protein
MDFAQPTGAAAIARGTARLLDRMGHAALAEVTLPDGSRADLLALAADGSLLIIEVKSCARDFLCDRKWQGYRAWCDGLCFAVDAAFPQVLLPQDSGLLVADAFDAVLLRPPPVHRLAAARRAALTRQFGLLAARRLAGFTDPHGAADRRAALAGL